MDLEDVEGWWLLSGLIHLTINMYVSSLKITANGPEKINAWTMKVSFEQKAYFQGVFVTSVFMYHLFFHQKFMNSLAINSDPKSPSTDNSEGRYGLVATKKWTNSTCPRNSIGLFWFC